MKGGAAGQNGLGLVRASRPLSRWALWGILSVSVVFLVVSSLWSGHPPLLLLMAYLLASFFGIGLLFGNLTTLAMQPLGAIAGTGSAVVGATSMLISLTLGTAIGQSYNGTVMPLVGGFALLSLCSIVAACLVVRSLRSLAPERISLVAVLSAREVPRSCVITSVSLSPTALVSALSLAKAPW